MWETLGNLVNPLLPLLPNVDNSGLVRLVRGFIESVHTTFIYL